MKKGQARLIEHTLTILLSVLVIVSISGVVFTFYTISLRTEITENLKQLIIQTSDNINRIYDAAHDSKVQPSNYTSVLLKEIDLKLPADVSRRSYEIILVSANPVWTSLGTITIDGETITPTVNTSGAKIIARTTEDPKISLQYDIPNIDVFVQGKSENGIDDTLKYYRYNINGTVYDRIVLGKSDILVTITQIS